MIFAPKLVCSVFTLFADDLKIFSVIKSTEDCIVNYFYPIQTLYRSGALKIMRNVTHSKQI
jgi:hypothetical protein